MKSSSRLSSWMMCFSAHTKEADGCNCRKAKARPVKEAAHKWQIDLGRSLWSAKSGRTQRRPGMSAALRYCCIHRGLARSHHDFVVTDLACRGRENLRCRPVTARGGWKSKSSCSKNLQMTSINLHELLMPTAGRIFPAAQPGLSPQIV